MVIGVFPIAKLGALFIKQISKPIANFVKERAKQNYFFRTYVCMPPAQFYNWCEVRCKMWVMGMGKPDSIPRLNEQMAIELGANLLGETIVFVSAAGIILLEYNRQLRKETNKENERKAEIEAILNKIAELSFQVENQDAHIRCIQREVSLLDSLSIKKPWKGQVTSVQSAPEQETSQLTQQKPECKVTKEDAKKSELNTKLKPEMNKFGKSDEKKI